MPAADQPRRLIAVLAPAVAVLLLAACGTPPPKLVTLPTASPTGSPSPSPSPSASTSPLALASPSAVSTPSAPPTPALSGAPLTASGAYLTAPQIEPAPKGNAGTCQAWVDAGWTGDCGMVQIVGGSPAGAIAWVIEKQASQAVSGTEAWRVLAMTTDGTEPVWHIRLIASDAGGAWGGVSMRATPLEGNGQSQLVFGFRLLGGDATLAYDVVALNGGQPTVAVHRALSHGAAQLSGGDVIDYAAQYPHGGTTPADWLESTIHWSDGAFRISAQQRVGHPPVGDFP
jgi:hypothetical protein